MSDVQQNEGPSIGELIATRRFLGREFIAWLWFETEIFEEKFQIAGKHVQHPDNFGACEIFIDKVLTLESPGEGAVPQKSALTGSLPGATPEAREALVQGKLPTKARFFVRREEQEFAFTIEGDSLALSAVKIPVVLRTGDDDPFFERMFLVEAIEAAVETLFGVFLELRLRDAWQRLVLPAMRSWMRNHEDLYDAAIEEYRGARAR